MWHDSTEVVEGRSKGKVLSSDVNSSCRTNQARKNMTVREVAHFTRDHQRAKEMFAQWMHKEIRLTLP